MIDLRMLLLLLSFFIFRFEMKAKFDREMSIVSKEIPPPPLEDIRAALGFSVMLITKIQDSLRNGVE